MLDIILLCKSTENNVKYIEFVIKVSIISKFTLKIWLYKLNHNFLLLWVKATFNHFIYKLFIVCK